MNFKYYYWGVIILAVAAFSIFGKSLPYEFLMWDDNILVTDNSTIKGFTASNIRSMFINEHGLIIPLVWLSFAVDYHFYELDPWGFRLTNLILHILNMGIVFYLFSFFIDSRKYSQKQLWIAGITVALIWGLHPLRVESVVWIAERKDVLSGFFCLLSLVFYLQYASSVAPEDSFLRADNSGNNRWKLLLSIGLFILALLSKPSVLPYPVVLVLLDFYPLQRLKFTPKFTTQLIKRCCEKWAFFIPGVCAVLLTLFTTHSSDALVSINKYPIVYRFTNAIYSLTLYLVNTVFPVKLLPFYSMQTLSLTNPLIICTLILYATTLYILIQMALKKSRYWGIVAFGICIVMLLPLLGFFLVGSHGAADRYTYLVTIPFYFLLGYGLLHNMRNKWVWICVAIWSSLLVFKTINQQNIWKDTETFFIALTQGTPAAPAFIYNKLGSAFLKNGEPEKAMAQFKSALSKIGQPYQWAQSSINLGNLYYKQKQWTQAEFHYRETIRYSPESYLAYSNLGNVYAKNKYYKEAVEAYLHSISLEPGYAGAHHNLGYIYMKLERYKDAEESFIKALNIDPDYKLSRKLLKSIQAPENPSGIPGPDPIK